MKAFIALTVLLISATFAYGSEDPYVNENPYEDSAINLVSSEFYQAEVTSLSEEILRHHNKKTEVMSSKKVQEDPWIIPSKQVVNPYNQYVQPQANGCMGVTSFTYTQPIMYSMRGSSGGSCAGGSCSSSGRPGLLGRRR